MSRNEFICDCNCIHEEQVAKTLARMPDAELLERLAQFYKMIGDSTRCKILFALLEQPMCVCDLANVLSMTKSAVSHQLSKMRACNMIACEKIGKEVYYRLDDHHVSAIFEMSLTHICHRKEEEA